MGVSPVHQLNPYNGLANSRFHTLLFGNSRLRSDTMPHFCANSRCLGAFVQLVCNQQCDGFSQRPAQSLMQTSEEELVTFEHNSCHEDAGFEFNSGHFLKRIARVPPKPQPFGVTAKKLI